LASCILRFNKRSRGPIQKKLSGVDEGIACGEAFRFMKDSKGQPKMKGKEEERGGATFRTRGENVTFQT